MNAGEKQTNRLTAEVKRINRHASESIDIITYEARSDSLATPAAVSQITNTASTRQVSARLHHVTVQLFIVGEATAVAVKTNGSNIDNLLPMISNTTPPLYPNQSANPASIQKQQLPLRAARI